MTEALITWGPSTASSSRPLGPCEEARRLRPKGRAHGSRSGSNWWAAGSKYRVHVHVAGSNWQGKFNLCRSGVHWLRLNSPAAKEEAYAAQQGVHVVTYALHKRSPRW